MVDNDRGGTAVPEAIGEAAAEVQARTQTADATAAAEDTDVRQPSKYPIAYHVSNHEMDIERYFAAPGRTLIADRSRIPIEWSLAVCFVNRSGSNWVADLLAATKKAGRAGEYLNSEVVKRQCDEHGHASFDADLRWLAKRTSRGGCFAFKVGASQLHFIRRIRVVPDLLPDTKYILCRRRDIAAQALSFIKAARTLEWRRLPGERPAEFDYDGVKHTEILRTIRSISNQYASFEEYFSVFGIDYISVVYEELLTDTPRELTRVAEALGIETGDPEALIGSLRTSVVQRDEASERRLRRFHSAMGRR